MNWHRAKAVLGVLVAPLMLVPLLMTQSGDIGKSPRQVLDPKLVRQLTGEPTETVPASELARLRGEVRSIHEQLQEMLDISRVVSRNTPRIDSLESRMDRLESSQRSDPTNIAVLQDKVQNIHDTQEKQLAITGWALGGIGTLILGCLGVLIKRWVTRFTPPKWAEQSVAKEVEHRRDITEGLAEVRAAMEKIRTNGDPPD